MAGQRWHPGEHESRSCLTKLRYPSGIAAGKAKQALRRAKRTGPAAETINVYRCQYCGGWHLGRPRKQRTLRNRAAVRFAQQAEIHAD